MFIAVPHHTLTLMSLMVQYMS